MIRKEAGQTAEIVDSSQVITDIKVVVKRIRQKGGQGKVFLCDAGQLILRSFPILYFQMLPTPVYTYRDDLLPPPPPLSPPPKKVAKILPKNAKSILRVDVCRSKTSLFQPS